MEEIHWYQEESKGYVSLYATNITLNMQAKAPFEEIPYVRVGINEKGQLLIVPVAAGEEGRYKAQGITLFAVSSKKSYARINSTSLVRFIASKMGLSLENTPVKLVCHYDDNIGLIAEKE